MRELLAKLVRRRELWTIAIYKVNSPRDVLRLPDFAPFHRIGERGLRRSRDYRATVADPFLFPHGERLFLFYEVQTDFGIGKIHAQSMDASGDFTDHGLVLSENFHLSYPQVFEHEGRVWMIPESAQAGKVWLYQADEHLLSWHPVRPLIDEVLVDASLVSRQDGLYLLGTNRNSELVVFHATALDKPFKSTGVVATADKEFSRNGGRPLLIDGQHYRISQNCARRYGENTSISLITHLSPTCYREELMIRNLFDRRTPKWMSLGHHHISAAAFAGEHYIAVDGYQGDLLVNNLALALLKLTSPNV